MGSKCSPKNDRNLDVRAAHSHMYRWRLAFCCWVQHSNQSGAVGESFHLFNKIFRERLRSCASSTLWVSLKTLRRLLGASTGLGSPSRLLEAASLHPSNKFMFSLPGGLSPAASSGPAGAIRLGISPVGVTKRTPPNCHGSPRTLFCRKPFLLVLMPATILFGFRMLILFAVMPRA